ncbi:hypothetical protein G9A89_015271 [Geosiphon pyriformis]|nr:hypothetical protein G9A89_015271 [Geosiphon pyriformis]
MKFCPSLLKANSIPVSWIPSSKNCTYSIPVQLTDLICQQRTNIRPLIRTPSTKLFFNPKPLSFPRTKPINMRWKKPTKSQEKILLAILEEPYTNHHSQGHSKDHQILDFPKNKTRLSPSLAGKNLYGLELITLRAANYSPIFFSRGLFVDKQRAINLMLIKYKKDLQEREGIDSLKIRGEFCRGIIVKEKPRFSRFWKIIDLGRINLVSDGLELEIDDGRSDLIRISSCLAFNQINYEVDYHKEPEPENLEYETLDQAFKNIEFLKSVDC